MDGEEEQGSSDSPLNISFSGCGFLGIYHIGVIQCLRENAPSLIPRFHFIAGASAGALASLVLLSHCPIDKVCKAIIETAEMARKPWIGPFSTSFDIMSILDSLFDDLLPPNVHRVCNGRLQISLTAVSDLKNVMATEFNTRLELIRVLKATCFIPVWAGFSKHSYRGKVYMDGGMSDNLPMHFPGETITVSPFSGEADICPRDQREGWDMSLNISGTSVRMTLANAYRMKSALFPPDSAVLERMYQGGYRDCLRFLKQRAWLESVPPAPSSPEITISLPRGSISVSRSTLQIGAETSPRPDGYRLFSLPKVSVHIAQEFLGEMSSVLLEFVSSSYAKSVSPSVMQALALMDSLLKGAPSSFLRKCVPEVRFARSCTSSSGTLSAVSSSQRHSVVLPLDLTLARSRHVSDAALSGEDSGVCCSPTAASSVNSFFLFSTPVTCSIPLPVAGF